MVPRFLRIGREKVIPAILAQYPNVTTTTSTTLIRTPPPFSTLQRPPSPPFLQPPLLSNYSSYLKPSSSILSRSSIVDPSLLLPPIPTDIPLSFYSSPYTTYAHDDDEANNIPEDGGFLNEHLPLEVVKLLSRAQAALIYCSKSASGWAGELTLAQVLLWVRTLIALYDAYEALKPYGLVLAETLKDTFLRLFGNNKEIQQEQEQAPAPKQAPEPKPEPEPPEQEREPKPESAEPKPEAKPPESKPKQEPKSAEPESAESKSEPKSAESKPETAVSKPKTEPESIKPKLEPESVPKSEPAEPKSEAAEPEPKPKPKPESEPKPKPKAESEPAKPKPKPEAEQAKPKPESERAEPDSEPEEESTVSFFQLLVSPNHIKYFFVLFGVTEEDHVGAEIRGENILVVKTFVENSPDSDPITMVTLHLPPGDFSNVHPRTKFSIKNGVFLVELQGFQITNPSSSSSSHGVSS